VTLCGPLAWNVSVIVAMLTTPSGDQAASAL
jgi:hypothetical protein